MKGFAKIALSVALIAIIVLSIVVASVAWFTSNPEVDANDVTLDAARTLAVAFDPTVRKTNYKYNGQVGNVASGDDAPYVYQAGSFTIRVDSLSSDTMAAEVTVGFGTVDVLTQSVGTIYSVLISDLFTITADIYQANASGAYVKVDIPKQNEEDPTLSYFRDYEGAADDELPRYAKAIANLTIADDGKLMNGANPARFGTGSYELSLTYTFLPEAAYAVWSSVSPDYSTIYGYEYAPSDGGYIGVLNYTAYKAKYHYGLPRYSKEGNVYTLAENGEYVRVVTAYQPYESVTKYDSGHNISASGTYIKVGDSNDYVLFQRYNRINGFPYSDDKYEGEKFRFTVACAVEEVENEA